MIACPDHYTNSITCEQCQFAAAFVGSLEHGPSEPVPPPIIAEQDMLIARPDISPTSATYVRRGDPIPFELTRFVGVNVSPRAETHTARTKRR